MRAPFGSSSAAANKRPSTYLHKLENLDLGLEAKTTAFFHSNGAAVWL